MAVGFAVTGVAFAAYATVRMQSMNSLDESLHSRASRAAHASTIDQLSQEITPWALGAADVKIVVLDAGNASVRPQDKDALSVIGRSEVKVALGQSTWSARTVRIDG